MRTALLHSGSEIHGETGNWGSVGLLVVSLTGTVFALTALPILIHSRRLSVPLGNRLVRLPVPEAVRSASAARNPVAAIEIPAGVLVAANAAGLGEAGAAIDIVDSLETPIAVHHRYGNSIGQITGIGQRASFAGMDAHGPIEGLFELELAAGQAQLTAGDGGALVSTLRGQPVGLVVGSRRGAILCAPLASFMRSRGFVPLDAFSATSQNSTFYARGVTPSATTEQSEAGGRRIGPTVGSQELLERAGLKEMIAELEDAEA
jgi:hypothetical protein